MQKSNFIITIDGTAGSGKSTIAKLIARKYNFKYLPTGVLYRKLAKLVYDHNVDLNSIHTIKELLIGISNGSEEDLLDESLYQEEISSLASKLAQLPEVREYFFLLQRKFIQDNKQVILEGRDTGTVIAPEAHLKIFLTADPIIRAQRRNLEYKDKDSKELENNIKQRDRDDSTRLIAPLSKPIDAVEIDSSDLSIEQVFDLISNHINSSI
jgi:cytidylate kinase